MSPRIWIINKDLFFNNLKELWILIETSRRKIQHSKHISAVSKLLIRWHVVSTSKTLNQRWKNVLYTNFELYSTGKRQNSASIFKAQVQNKAQSCNNVGNTTNFQKLQNKPHIKSNKKDLSFRKEYFKMKYTVLKDSTTVFSLFSVWRNMLRNIWKVTNFFYNFVKTLHYKNIKLHLNPLIFKMTIDF